MNQKKLKFKSDRNNKGRLQKRKANNKFDVRKWKSKLQKAIKTDQGFKSIMSIMASEDQFNQALVLALTEYGSQPHVTSNKSLI